MSHGRKKDVVVIQMGEEGNYASSHFWNMQEELQIVSQYGGQENGRHESISADPARQKRTDTGLGVELDKEVVFMCEKKSGWAGEGQGDWMPRAVVVDAQGSVRRWDGVHEHGSRQEDVLWNETWDGGVVNCCSSDGDERGMEYGVQRHASQQHTDLVTNLSDTGKTMDHLPQKQPIKYEYWGDYTNVSYAWKHAVEGVWRGDVVQHEWNSAHALGMTDVKLTTVVEDMMESIRIIAERSDGVEGFIHVGDDCSMWGRLASLLLQDVRDEYGCGRPVYLFGTRRDISADASSQQTMHRVMTEGIAMAALTPLLDVYVPLENTWVPHADDCRVGSWKKQRLKRLFDTSLLHAAVIHGATMPFRIHHNNDSNDGAVKRSLGFMSMSEIATLLQSPFGSPLCAADVVFPAIWQSEEIQSNATLDNNDTRVHKKCSEIATISQHRTFMHDSIPMTRQLHDEGDDEPSPLLHVGTDGDQGRQAEVVTCMGTCKQFHSIAEIDARIQALMMRDPVRRTQHRVITIQGIPSMGYLQSIPMVSRAYPDTRGIPDDVPSVVRLSATASWKRVVDSTRGSFVKATRSNKSSWEDWGLQEDDIAEMTEYMANLSDKYSHCL